MQTIFSMFSSKFLKPFIEIFIEVFIGVSDRVFCPFELFIHILWEFGENRGAMVIISSGLEIFHSQNTKKSKTDIKFQYRL